MVGGEGGRGPLWVDGRLTVRVRGPGREPARVVRLPHPFARIGRGPGVDLRIDGPGVDSLHALLILDERGIFGVDLRTPTGTRFAGADLASSRLGLGDVVEVDGWRLEILQIRLDGRPVDPPLSDDDPLAEADPSALLGLSLQGLDDGAGPAWMLGSSLAFAGSGEACAVRVADAPEVACALLRGPSSTYVIDLLGGPLLLDGRPVDGASALVDGDVLTIGRSRFAVGVAPARWDARLGALSRFEGSFGDVPGLPADLAGSPRAALLALILTAAARPPGEAQDEVLRTLRLFQADAAALFAEQLDRIEALGREIAAIRDQVERQPEPPEPLRLDLVPSQPAGPGGSPDWLLERLRGLESESRSTWKDLIARISATIRPRTAPGSAPTPGPEIAQDRPGHIAKGGWSVRTTRPQGAAPGRIRGPSLASRVGRAGCL